MEIETELPIMYQKGKYRQLLAERKTVSEKEGGNAGLAIAIAMLVFVIAVGAYENRDTIFEGLKTPSTEANVSEMEGDSIPVEVIPGTEVESEQKKGE